MAKNKDTQSGNLTGILDFEERTVTDIDKKNGGEIVYSLDKFLKKYDGLEVSLTAAVNMDIEPDRVE